MFHPHVLSNDDLYDSTLFVDLQPDVSRYETRHCIVVKSKLPFRLPFAFLLSYFYIFVVLGNFANFALTNREIVKDTRMHYYGHFFTLQNTIQPVIPKLEYSSLKLLLSFAVHEDIQLDIKVYTCPLNVKYYSKNVSLTNLFDTSRRKFLKYNIISIDPRLY